MFYKHQLQFFPENRLWHFIHIVFHSCIFSYISIVQDKRGHPDNSVLVSP